MHPPDHAVAASDPRRRRRVPWRSLALAAGLVALGMLAFTLPIRVFFVYLPGPVRDVAELVDVSGARSYSSEGDLYMTTVSVDVDVTAAELLTAAVDPQQAVVLEKQVTGRLTLEQLEAHQREEMTASQRHAREVALGALGYGEATGDGARVVSTRRGAPADGLLRANDVIVAVDGRRVATTCDLSHALDRLRVGEEVDLKVRRGAETMTVTVRTASSPVDHTAAYIGVDLRDVNYEFDTEVTVDFETGKIAGPSAGLMFTLALYDRLTPEDLTGGRSIAGTGEVDCGGGVGSIGGIEQKVAAAESHGADVFLAPADNAPAARSVADDIEVVAVSSFSDALDCLERDAS